MKFPNIDWWCDSCRAYLNDQPGFRDDRGSWRCRECGFNNSISDADIQWNAPADDGPTCASCGGSLAGGSLTLPWEAGGNPSAYVTCPHCGYENLRSGFGEDDD